MADCRREEWAKDRRRNEAEAGLGPRPARWIDNVTQQQLQRLIDSLHIRVEVVRQLLRKRRREWDEEKQDASVVGFSNSDWKAYVAAIEVRLRESIATRAAFTAFGRGDSCEGAFAGALDKLAPRQVRAVAEARTAEAGASSSSGGWQGWQDWSDWTAADWQGQGLEVSRLQQASAVSDCGLASVQRFRRHGCGQRRLQPVGRRASSG